MLRVMDTPNPLVLLAVFEHGGDNLEVQCTAFPNGRLAVLLTSGGRPYCRWSVNLPELPVEPGEFFAKTHDENAELREPLLATGLFDVLPARAVGPLVEFELWRLRPRVLQELQGLMTRH